MKGEPVVRTSRDRCPPLAATALLLLLLASCAEDSTAPRADPCTDAHYSSVSQAGSPPHVHDEKRICEEDRGKTVQVTIGGADHTHLTGFNGTEVDLILDGQGLSKMTGRAEGHTHWMSFNGGSK